MSIKALEGLTDSEEYKLRRQAGIAIHHCMIQNNSIPSCWNCNNFEKTNELCKKFDVHPPAEILIFSCGIINWEEITPF